MKSHLIHRTYSPPFGMLVQERVYTAEEYRFGFNGKEKDDEVSGAGNQYDYGFRIYNSRISKFLSVDPLTKSYPFYSPFQFAGNKPIQAVDMDGLEEKIVIYENTSNGKVRTTTLNSNDLIKTTQLSGSFALNKSISKKEFENSKKLYFEGFRLAPGLFASGFKEYTQAQAPDNTTTGFIGPKYGTLTIGVGPNGNAISYDPTPVQEEQESTFAIVKRNLQNPDAQTKAAMNTMKNYVAGVSLAVSLPALLTTAPSVSLIPEYLGAVSNFDQVTGSNLSSTENPQVNQVINLTKTAVGIWSFRSGFNSIDKATDAIPQMITGGSGSILDGCDAAVSSAQD